MIKKIVISNIMNYIKKYNNYSKQQLLEIEYGLVSIYLTVSKVIIISILSYFLGTIKEMLIFMLFFNIIRATAFGLHATKSWICLISSTVIFIGIPIICTNVCFNFYFKLFVGLIFIMLIYKYAPADTKKRPIVNKKRRLRLKLISTFISIIYVIICLFIRNQFISNCLIFSLCLENCLINPLVYKLFNLPYNNYIDFLKSHPDFTS